MSPSLMARVARGALLVLVLVAGAARLTGASDSVPLCPGEQTLEDAAATYAVGFGFAMDLDGDTLVVGAYNGNAIPPDNTGEAHVFVRDVDGSWILQQSLAPSTWQGGGAFGWAVAVSGDLIAVASRNAALNGSGRVFVFSRSAGTWTEEAVLDAPAAVLDDGFGAALTMDGSTLVVGQPNAVRGSTNWAGAVHVYIRDAPGTWRHDAEIRSTRSGSQERFGTALDLQGDRLLIGAPYRQGAAEIWERQAGTFSNVVRLVGPSLNTENRFGHAVRLDGDQLIVGAPWTDTPAQYAGSAFVYRLDGTWQLEARLDPSNAAGRSEFGMSVALAGDVAAVGAPWRGNECGGAYLFERGPGGWRETFARTGPLPRGTHLGECALLDGEGSVLFGAYEAGMVVGARGAVHVLPIRDADGDGAIDPCDCDPANPVPTVPGEVLGLRVSSGALVSWDDVGPTEEPQVHRGTIGPRGLNARSPAFDHACFENGDALGDGWAVSTDASSPPAGALGWYYLVRAATDCGAGSLGSDSFGASRPAAAACPSVGRCP